MNNCNDYYQDGIKLLTKDDENTLKQTIDLLEGFGKAINENLDYMNVLADRLNLLADAFNSLVDRIEKLENNSEQQYRWLRKDFDRIEKLESDLREFEKQKIDPLREWQDGAEGLFNDLARRIEKLESNIHNGQTNNDV